MIEGYSAKNRLKVEIFAGTLFNGVANMSHEYIGMINFIGDEVIRFVYI